MTTIKYGFLKKTSLGFDEAVGAVTSALADEGFGILTEIDVQAVLKKKLDIDRPRYLILGACNPNLASSVLNAEPWVGLLLPCNVVVQETEGGTEVGFMDPEAILSMSGNTTISETACEARDRLLKVADHLPDRP